MHALSVWLSVQIVQTLMYVSACPLAYLQKKKRNPMHKVQKV